MSQITPAGGDIAAVAAALQAALGSGWTLETISGPASLPAGTPEGISTSVATSYLIKNATLTNTQLRLTKASNGTLYDIAVLNVREGDGGVWAAAFAHSWFFLRHNAPYADVPKADATISGATITFVVTATNPGDWTSHLGTSTITLSSGSGGPSVGLIDATNVSAAVTLTYGSTLLGPGGAIYGDLPIGTQTLTYARPGYNSATQSITVAAGQMTALTAPAMTLKVYSFNGGTAALLVSSIVSNLASDFDLAAPLEAYSQVYTIDGDPLGRVAVLAPEPSRENVLLVLVSSQTHNASGKHFALHPTPLDQIGMDAEGELSITMAETNEIIAQTHTRVINSSGDMLVTGYTISAGVANSSFEIKLYDGESLLGTESATLGNVSDDEYSLITFTTDVTRYVTEGGSTIGSAPGTALVRNGQHTFIGVANPPDGRPNATVTTTVSGACTVAFASSIPVTEEHTVTVTTNVPVTLKYAGGATIGTGSSFTVSVEHGTTLSIEAAANGYTTAYWSSAISSDRSVELTLASANPQDGHLEMIGTSGALVFVNGTYSGLIPVILDLAAGTYSVEVSKQGYETYTNDAVAVVGGETTTMQAILAEVQAPIACGFRITNNTDTELTLSVERGGSVTTATIPAGVVTQVAYTAGQCTYSFAAQKSTMLRQIDCSIEATMATLVEGEIVTVVIDQTDVFETPTVLGLWLKGAGLYDALLPYEAYLPYALIGAAGVVVLGMLRR